MALSLGLASSAMAQGRHKRTAPTVRPGRPDAFVSHDKMDRDVSNRTGGSYGMTADVIVTLEPGTDLPSAFLRYSHNGKLNLIHAYVLDGVPVSLLSTLANNSNTHRVNLNRPARKHDALSSYSVNANAVDTGNGINNGALYSYTGAGVTVAVIDSGVSSYSHPDLASGRILTFVDFVNQNTLRYDDNGHGTHVAGIVGGTGKLSAKKYAGMAPGASLVSLKVLDQDGCGSVGNILKALDWVYVNATQYGIRVVNMSVGAAVTESYYTDPLTLATKALVDRGITVVAAAGNNGQDANGKLQWGGIASPGNAPWVLTVCAFSTLGTYNVKGDAVADFSSSGPTAVDFGAKPDLCAPGVGVVSTAAPGSELYQDGQLASPSWLLPGTIQSSYAYVPYESMTGTSMATPFVSGAVALMLQANPKLTPNLIKGILEFTAISKPGVSPLRQGAGFMNVSNAVAMAALAAAPTKTSVPIPSTWSKHLIWGNHLISGGVIDPKANAWGLGVEWGWAKTANDSGDNIVWGTASNLDNIVWGTASFLDNIVWGTGLLADNIVWGTSGSLDNIVWGTANFSDNIVWGTDCGGADCDNVVWGTADTGDNIVWGTADFGDNIVWGTANSLDNIVWGTAYSSDNIVWGTAQGLDNIVWGTANLTNIVWPIFRGGK